MDTNTYGLATLTHNNTVTNLKGNNWSMFKQRGDYVISPTASFRNEIPRDFVPEKSSMLRVRSINQIKDQVNDDMNLLTKINPQYDYFKMGKAGRNQVNVQHGRSCNQKRMNFLLKPDAFKKKIQISKVSHQENSSHFEKTESGSE